MSTSHRNALRAMNRANHAPRSRGQFAAATPLPSHDNPNSVYWRDLAARCKTRLPQDLPWAALTTHLWPDEAYTPTWRETANAMTLATQAWNNGERNLEALAAKVQA